MPWARPAGVGSGLSALPGPAGCRSVVAVIGEARSWRQTVNHACARAQRDGARLTIVAVAPHEVHAPGGVHFVPCPGPLQAELDQGAVDLARMAAAVVPPDVPVTTIVRRGGLAAALRRELRAGQHQVAYVPRLRGRDLLHNLLLKRSAGEVEVVAIERG